MKIAIYIDTDNPKDKAQARKILDALEDVPAGFKSMAEYEAWQAKLKKENEGE